MSPLQKVLQKEVTRKQFLLIMLGVITSLFGLTSLFGAVAKPTLETPRNPGYGKAHYGP